MPAVLRPTRSRSLPMMAAVIVAVAMVATLAGHVGAQILAKRPITIVIPFTPGASSDTFQRLVAKKVTENTGQVFVIESRPGGGGAIGAAVVKQADPDGYTLFQANNGTHAVNVALYASLPYDPVKDFEPVTLMWSFPQLLVVPADSPAKAATDLPALAKAKPGGLSFGSQGNGSSGHILGELLKARSATPMVHIPYRGAGPASLDVSTGRIDFLFVSYASVLPFFQSGKVRALAVTSDQRLPALPDVPTMAEAGLPNFVLDAWFGLVAPAGTPRPVIDKLNAAFVQAVKDPEVIKEIRDQGAVAVSNTPQQFAAFIASETARWGDIVHQLGIKGD